MSKSQDKIYGKSKLVSNKTRKSPTVQQGNVITIDNIRRKTKEENNAYLASFPELNINPVMEVDRQGNLKYQNPACQRVFPDISTLGLKHPLFSNWANVLKELQLANPGQPVVREVSVGNSFYEQVYFAINNNHIRIYGRDITKRTKAEQALQAAHETLRKSHDNSPLGIRIVSEDGKNLYANRAILDIFGYDSIEDFNTIPIKNRYTPESNAQGLRRSEQRRHGERTLFNYELGIVRKDGAIRHLQAFRSEVLWEGKQEYQTIYIDITARKKAEQALQIIQETLRKSQDNSPLGIRIVSQDGKNLYANRTALDMLGYESVEEFDTIPIKNRYTPASYAESEVRGEKRRRGEPVEDGYEINILHKDGMLRHLQVFRNEVLWEGQLQNERLYLDITDHKNAEQALQATEENFRNSIENSPIGIRIVTDDGETLYINHALLDLYGYKNIEEFKATPARSRYTPKSYLEFHDRSEKRQHGEPLPNNYEVNIVCKDGTVRHLQVFRKAVLWGGKRQYQALYLDITERKQMLTRINDLNDILQLITNINQLIVQIDNESELLQKACEQFITSRQYRLAWIGFKQENSYDILPSAMSGKDTSYLSSVRITWDNSDFGQGPTGTAIKTGKTCVIRDILHDPRFEPWRDAALSRGFKSLVALPLVIEDKVIGALTIHSLFNDAFDQKELELLTELASDLSLGIEKIRHREEHALIEQALRQERDRAQAYLDVAGVMIMVLDSEEKVILINRRGCEILGYEASEIIGKKWYTNFLPEKKRKKASDYFRRVVAGEIEPVRQYENQVITKDSQERTIVWNSVELRDDKGKIIGILCSGEDITERKQAEEALKASEEKYSTLVEESTDGILILRDRKIEFANQQILEMSGYSQNELLGKSFPELFAPEYKELLDEGYHRRKASPVVLPTDYQLEILSKSGRKIPVETKAKRIIYKDRNDAMVIIRDITERKKSEEVLKLSEQNFRNSMDSSVLGIRIMGDSANTLYANNKLLDMFGYENIDELRASPPQEHYTPESYDGFVQWHEKFLRGESLPDQLEFDIIRKDGAIRHLQIFSKNVL